MRRGNKTYNKLAVFCGATSLVALDPSHPIYITACSPNVARPVDRPGIFSPGGTIDRALARETVGPLSSCFQLLIARGISVCPWTGRTEMFCRSGKQSSADHRFWSAVTVLLPAGAVCAPALIAWRIFPPAESLIGLWPEIPGRWR